MEDATDAELNTENILDVNGYRWNTSNGGATAGGAQEGSSGSSNGLLVNVEDLDGKTLTYDQINGNTFDIYIGGSLTPETRAVITTTEYGAVNFYMVWDGYVPYDNTEYKIVPVGGATLPLQDGDAWVYNGSESKFKPTPTVPTVVVTEFPASPDANTLYIKVV